MLLALDNLIVNRRYNHNLDWICEDECVKVQSQLAHVGTAGAHGQHARAAVEHQTKHFHSVRASSREIYRFLELFFLFVWHSRGDSFKECEKSGLFEKTMLWPADEPLSKKESTCTGFRKDREDQMLTFYIFFFKAYIQCKS
jgi:hypothetical protein